MLGTSRGAHSWAVSLQASIVLPKVKVGLSGQRRGGISHHMSLFLSSVSDVVGPLGFPVPALLENLAGESRQLPQGHGQTI